MGILTCSDCGGKVSDRVDYCPHCGAPMKPGLPTDRRPDVPAESGGGCMRAFLVSFFIVLLLAAAGAAGWYWYTHFYITEPVLVTASLRDAANSYDTLGEFYDGVARVTRGDHVAFININGDVVDAPAQREGAAAFHTPDETGLVRVERGGRWGMIDRETRDTVIRPLYTTLGSFYGGIALATVKFGDRSMPEYLCYYGYVDTRGNHTFTPEQFRNIDLARQRAERREYIESLPHGITARSLGLPEGVQEVRVAADSAGSWTLRFDKDGVLMGYDFTPSGGADRHYGVSGGYVTSMSTKTSDGVIRTFRYLRERLDDFHEAIIRQGADGRRRVGTVEYSPDDGTVVSASFEGLPDLSTTPATMQFYNRVRN